MLSAKEIEMLAKDKQKMPKNSPLADVFLYWAFCGLYTLYYAEEIGTEQASAEKKAILSLYGQYLAEENARKEVYIRYQDNIKKAGRLPAEIEKSENVQEIAEKACEYIGCMTGDGSFSARQKKKFEED